MFHFRKTVHSTSCVSPVFSQHFRHQMCGVFPPKSEKFSMTPAGCPTVKLNSDTTWRQCQIPQVKGSAPQHCPHFRHQLLQIAGPQIIHNSVQLGYKLEVPMTASTLDLIIRYNSLLNVPTFPSLLKDIIKDTGG